MGKTRLTMVGNRVLTRVFGSKRNEVTGGWRKLHNEQLRNLYSLPYIIKITKSRRMSWAGHAARMGNMRNSHTLVEKPEGRIPFRRPRHR
jgi:hypothetical protein